MKFESLFLGFYMMLSRIFFFVFKMVLVVVCSLLFSAQVQSAENHLSDLWELLKAKEYKEPSNDEMKWATQLFHQAMDKNSQSINNKAAIASDLFIEELVDGTLSKLLIIRETAQKLNGRGLFVMRPDGNGILLQAPHGYMDVYTGKLVSQMMQEQNYSALSVNSVPRRYKKNKKWVNADMAHLTSTYFYLWSQIFAEKFPSGQIIQLHGFNNKNRSTTKNVDIILSNGTQFVDVPLLKQAQCLKNWLGESRVLVYPREIKILGATSNSIGSLLRDKKFTDFKHYEMSLDLRKRLVNESESRKILTNCITMSA